jgi:hypothetical protein
VIANVSESKARDEMSDMKVQSETDPAIKKDPPSGTVVFFPSIEQRYSSATIEKSARIQARQLIQLTYITILATLLAAILSGRLELKILSNYSALVLCVGVPCLATVFAAWCGNHDASIALLDNYCRRLEIFGARFSTATAPGWYDASDYWYHKSTIGRYWSNVAFGIVLFGSSLMTTLIFYGLQFKHSALSCQAGIMAFIIVYRVFRLPVAQYYHDQGMRFRYYSVTVTLFAVCTAVIVSIFHVTIHDIGEIRIEYPYHILTAATVASLFPNLVHIEFERRRLKCLARGEANESQSVVATGAAVAMQRIQIESKD